MTDKPLLYSYLEKKRACRAAREWVRDKDLATAWATCPKSDWMRWLIERTDLIYDPSCPQTLYEATADQLRAQYQLEDIRRNIPELEHA